MIILVAAGGFSQPNPVGGAITSPAKARGIDKGFHKIDGVLLVHAISENGPPLELQISALPVAQIKGGLEFETAFARIR